MSRTSIGGRRAPWGLWSGALLTLGTMTGCAWSPPPESVPTYRIDVMASEVTAQGPGSNEEVATIFREKVGAMLHEMVADRGDLSPDSPPARFRAHISYDQSSWPSAPCLVLLVLVGCPGSQVHRSVDLTLEIDGEVYEGHGEASGAASLYYNSGGYGTTQTALEEALKDALRKKGKAIGRLEDREGKL